MTVLLADLPNPIETIGNWIGGAASGAASKAAEATFGFFMRMLADALAHAAAKVIEELLHYLDRSSGVSLDQGWFAGPRAREIVASVLLFAAVLMVLFLLAAVVQGVLNGDPAMMLRSALVEMPLSVFAVTVLGAVTAALLAVTDGASAMVLSGAPESLTRFLSIGQPASILSGGLLAIFMVVLFIVASVLVWIELVVRSSLIYLLVAFAPLVLAARVWPVLRGAWHQLCRLGVALVLSKFVIALALGLGAAALGGGGPGNLGASGPNPNDVGSQVGLTIGGVMVGACLMMLAAFAPFVVLKLLPVFEAAVLAQGISRGPVRGAQTAMQTAYYAQGLRGLAGRRQGTGAAGAGGGSGGGGGGGAAGGSGSGPAAGGGGGRGSATRGAATTAGSVGAGAGTGGARIAAPAVAGAAAGGAGAAAMVPVALAAKARSTASTAADSAASASAAPAAGREQGPAQ